MAEYPALPLFTDAFLSDTMHLDAQQTGAYLMLLMVAWRTSDCSIPNDDNFICKICRMRPREWLKIKELILSFWQEKDGRLYQKRLTSEAEYLRENSNKNRKAARLRWDNIHGKQLNFNKSIDANAMPNACQNDAPTPTPTPTPIRKITPVVPLKLFDQFWDAYPRQRRGSHAKALIAYRSALKRTTEEELYEAAKRYAGCDDVQRGFAKGAAAWLNDDRWQDQHADGHARTTANGKPAYADSIERATDGAKDLLREAERIRQSVE